MRRDDCLDETTRGDSGHNPEVASRNEGAY